MNRPDRKYIIILLMVTLLAIVFRVFQPAPIDFSEGYAAYETKPFGGYILYNTLDALFPREEILINSQPIYTIEERSQSSNYIFINSSFSLDEFETEILMNRVRNGDHIFMAATSFSGFLADSLNLKISQSFPSINPSAPNLDSLLQATTNFTNTFLKTEFGWSFPYTLMESHFDSFDSTKTTILGLVQNENVNFIKVEEGDGAFFFHTSPFLFTNYFLRDTSSYSYAYRALSYLPQAPTIWDEYYKPGRFQHSGTLEVVVNHPSLKWAWFTGLGGVILFLFLGGRRLQRIIPVIKPITNTSIDFAATIANMYLTGNNHKKILDKKITFFYDYLRTNLHIETTQMDEHTRTQIAQRSGIDLEHIQKLINSIEQAQQAREISTQILKQVTDQIDNFYKHTQR